MSQTSPLPQDRTPLSRQVNSAEQVASLDTETLERMHVAHEAEILSLTGRLEAYDPDPQWIKRARRALRCLHLHKAWISRELLKRKKASARAEQRHAAQAAADARMAAHLAHIERLEALQASRLQRIQAANDENAKQMAVFKEVAREVLGAEMYAHIWELARLRFVQSPKRTAP